MTFQPSDRSIHQRGGWLQRGRDLSNPDPSNRRRLVVFLATLVTALAVSLAYTWLRPAEYRASARIEITPAGAPAPAPPSATGPAASPAPESARPFLTEIQVLTSRPVLEQVAARLERQGRGVSAFGADPIAGMQSVLEAIPVPSTNVVELVATGPDPDLLARLVNATIEVYRDRLADAFRSSSSEALLQANDEVAKLEASVVAARREVEGFRVRNNIVSLEREENEVLAKVRNLSSSLNLANEKAAAAEGKLRALTESAAAGNAVARSRDDPTLANLEQRASQAREDLRDMERSFTPDYLAKEPKAVALRARLVELDRQIVVQREASQKAALTEAREELASTTGAVTRIQSQIAAGRQEVAQFTSRFNEYKTRQDDLGELEKTYRDAVQRRARLEASERARTPVAAVIEAATPPQQAWRPLYWRDTAISVGGSLLLALLVMWLVELFNRVEPQPAMVVVRPQPAGLTYDDAIDAVPRNRPQIASAERAAPALLPPQVTLPRELGADEVAALLRAADPDGRRVVLFLLCGISAGEAVGLRWSDVDVARGAGSYWRRSGTRCRPRQSFAGLHRRTGARRRVATAVDPCGPADHARAHRCHYPVRCP